MTVYLGRKSPCRAATASHLGDGSASGWRTRTSRHEMRVLEAREISG